MIRTLLQEGRVAEADAVSAAQRAIEAVIDLEELAPVSDEKSATEVACAALATLNALVSVPDVGADRAREVPVGAFSAAVSASAANVPLHLRAALSQLRRRAMPTVSY